MPPRPAVLMLPLALALLLVGGFLAVPTAEPGDKQVPRGRLVNEGLDHWDSSDPPPETQPTGIPGDAVELALVDTAFEPAEMTLPPGSTVHFINRGTTMHSVTGRAAGEQALALDRVLRPGDGFEWEVGTGTFELRCRFHSQDYDAGPMRARLHVQA